jgi:hypothetical protein
MARFPIGLYAATVVVGIALGACGGSLCDRAQSVFNSLQTKGQPCGVDAGYTVNKQQCEANLNQCSSSDKDNLSKALDCWDHVPACTTGGALQFYAGVAACLPNYMQITPACTQALTHP